MYLIYIIYSFLHHQTCYFLYITVYNTSDNIKPFSYFVHYGPKIFGDAGTMPVYKTDNKTESTHNDV